MFMRLSSLLFLSVYVLSPEFGGCLESFEPGKGHAPQILTPVHRSHLARRQLAQLVPSEQISLLYAPSDYAQPHSHYTAKVTWQMRYPGILVSDHSQIRSLSCDWDGIHLEFASQAAQLEAQAWKLPMVIVTEVTEGLCAFHDEGMEKYHPILIESYGSKAELEDSRSLNFQGFPSPWDVVAYDYDVELGRMEYVSASPSTADRVNPSRVKRSIRPEETPEKFEFPLSLNYDPRSFGAQRKSISMNEQVQGDLSLQLQATCHDCYLTSSLTLELKTGSRIVNMGLHTVTRLLRRLSQAEQLLRSGIRNASRNIQDSIVSQLKILNEELSRSLSNFYNKLAQLSTVGAGADKEKLLAEINQAANLVRQNSRQLLENTTLQLDTKLDGTNLSDEEKRAVISQLETILKDTEAHIDEATRDGSQVTFHQPETDDCDPIGEPRIQRRSLGLSCRRRKKSSVKLTGEFRVNFDIEMVLTGSRALVQTGDINILSASLVGLQIPGIISIGPQVRLAMSASLGFQRSASISFGADFGWQNVNVNVTGTAGGGSRGRNGEVVKDSPARFRFNPHRPKFELQPQELYASANLKPQLNFGIDLLLGQQELLVGIGGDLGLLNTLQLPDTSAHNCSDGYKYDLAVTSELDIYANFPTTHGLIGGLLSNIVPFLSSSTSSIVYPLWSMEPYTLLQHCFFGASSSSRQSNDGITSKRLTRATPIRDTNSKNISSQDLAGSI